MPPKSKIKKSNTGKLALPVVSMVKDLKLQTLSRKVLAEQLPKMLELYFQPKPEQVEALLDAASRFARGVCAQSLVYTWSDYARHLAKTAQTARKFLSMAGMYLGRDVAQEIGVAPIEVGALEIILHECPEYKQFSGTVRSMVAAIERAAASASRNAKAKLSPNEDLRKLLDKVVSIAKSHFLEDKLPQKEEANANDYDQSKYPLLSLAIAIEALSLEAAKLVVDKSPLPESDRETVKKRIQTKSAGAVIAELQQALARRRRKYR